MDMILYIAAIAVMIWAFCLSSSVKKTFRKYSEVRSHSGMTGAEVAHQILSANGIYDVQIQVVPGTLTDHYHPKKKTLNLSEAVANGHSVSAIAVAAHECGHAIQHHEGYGLLTFRNTLVPVANIGSTAGVWICILGFVFMPFILVPLGIGLFAFAVLFHLLTLPVEFNASRKAMSILENRGIVRYEEEREGATKVLKAAAMTYVAAALSAVITLLRLISRSRN